MTLTRSLYESPTREKNEQKYGHFATKQCICCMKPIKDGEECFQVHMNVDWVAVHPVLVSEETCEELTGAKSQGCFDLGSSCAKKMGEFAYKTIDDTMVQYAAFTNEDNFIADIFQTPSRAVMSVVNWLSLGQKKESLTAKIFLSGNIMVQFNSTKIHLVKQ